MEWTEPEVAFHVTKTTVKIPIYHVYKSSDICNRMSFWYTLDETEEPENEFDIREMVHEGNYPLDEDPTKRHQRCLQAALDSGEVNIDTEGNPFIITSTKEDKPCDPGQ